MRQIKIEGYGAYTVRFYDESGNTSYHRSYIDANAGSYDYTNYPHIAPDGTVIESALVPPSYDKISPEGGHNAFWTGHGGNTLEYSTGIDDLDSGDYGWNGDVISLTLDLMGEFNKAGLFGGTDYAPQYNIGIFEGNEVKVALSRMGTTDITDECEACGSLDEKGMTFEVFIPWERLVADANDFGMILGVNHEFTVDEVKSNGSLHKASVTLMDRFYDEEAGMVSTWGKYVTVCERCDDGLPGYIVGPPIKALGLKLLIADNKYSDLADSTWYTTACLYCSAKGYITGTGTNTFSPNTNVTRAQLVLILAKLANADLSKYTASSFNDVPTGKWYSNAVEWAYKNCLASGIGAKKFAPDGFVSRQQLCVFLKAFAEYNGNYNNKSADITGYSDYSDIAPWALNAFSWCVGQKLISGTGKTTLSPEMIATRAQLAVIIRSMVG